MSSFQALKEEAWQANQELPRRGVVLYTFGNVSAIDRKQGVFAIKPSGVPYESLKIDDMVVVDLECRIAEGHLKPSSDTRTHAVLYRRFSGIGGIVHTHSTHATAWSQAGRPIPVYGTTHADHLAVDVPCTKVMTDDSVFISTTNMLIARVIPASPEVTITNELVQIFLFTGKM